MLLTPKVTHLVGEVHVAWRVDEVERVQLPILQDTASQARKAAEKTAENAAEGTADTAAENTALAIAETVNSPACCQHRYCRNLQASSWLAGGSRCCSTWLRLAMLSYVAREGPTVLHTANDPQTCGHRSLYCSMRHTAAAGMSQRAAAQPELR